MPEAEIDPKTAAQAEMLANRLSKRAKHLRKWARRIGANSFRVYDRDIPEIPLLIDIYGDAVSGSLYERPYEKDDAEEELWLSAMADAVSSSLGVARNRVFLKRRKRQRGADQYERFGDQELYVEATEGGLRFRVNVSDYLDTGLFLDHRQTRSLVCAESAGKRVLNLFCYTGSFSVYAAAGGAAEVDSVDLSNTYLEWAGRNLALNGFPSEAAEPTEYAAGRPVPGRYRLVRADVLRFLAGAAAAGRKWDLVVLDPPTFSNSKKMAGTLDIRRDFRDLIGSCLSVTAPGGVLWFSTNARGFALDAADFPGVDVADVTGRTTDEDFAGRKSRVCYTLRR